jgi:hypothetical protein
MTYVDRAAGGAREKRNFLIEDSFKEKQTDFRDVRELRRGIQFG